jgi:hypothetical protein
MPFLVLAIVLVSLGWLLLGRAQRKDPAIRRVGAAFAILFVAGALALRAGPAGFGLLFLALVSLAVWFRTNRGGDDGPGDDGREPPDDAGPDPGPQAGLRLDQDELDRARREWERELPKRAKPGSTADRG